MKKIRKKIQKKIRTKICISTFCALFVLLGWVKDDDSLNRLQTLLEPYRAFQAELHRQDSSGEVLISKLWFQAPDKYRLELDDDTQIISDGKTRVLYEPDLEQATYEPARQNLESLPLLIFGAKKRELKAAYTIESQQLGEGETRYQLFSAASREMVLELYFVNDQPARLAWRDTLDNPIALDIKALSRDVPSADRFSFKQPEGVSALHLGEPIEPTRSRQ